MPWPRLVARSILLMAYSVWVGGFTFYGAIVIPVLHDEVGSIVGGHVTQRVSDGLNVIGLVTLLLWWMVAWSERRAGTPRARCARAVLLGVSSLLLAFLAVDHEILDDRLERFGVAGFYGYHRVYLVASTAQWVVNLMLLPVSLAIANDAASQAPPSRRLVGTPKPGGPGE